MIDRLRPDTSAVSLDADELKAQAMEYASIARDKLAEANEYLNDYVQKNPARAVGIALGLGVALAWLIKRR